MNLRRMIATAAIVAIAVIGVLAWKVTARAAYESAEYRVIESDGEFEIREYPDLMLASTNMRMDSNGNDGSFMRLFRYISGANEASQSVAMTTPVFMQEENRGDDGRMGFVMPRQVALDGVPEPASSDVQIVQRKGGRFVVIRFSGRMNEKLAKEAEQRLRKWAESRKLKLESDAELAGYDPPLTPPALRRNEVLIRVKQ